MKTAAPIFRCLFFATLAGAASGATYPYPDGSVSPFPPAFFGIGLVDPYNKSEATGVAAQGGVIFGVSAFVTDPPPSFGVGSTACVFNPRIGQLVVLPQPSSGVGIAFAISANGAVKVGTAAPGAYFWTSSDGDAGKALDGGSVARAVSADGSTAAGGAFDGEKRVAAIWTLPGGAKTTLGSLAGYDLSSAIGVSANGQIIAGDADNSVEAVENGAVAQTRAVRFVIGAPLEDLGTLPGFVNAFVYGMSADGSKIVGECHSDSASINGFVWSREARMQPLRSQTHTYTLGYAVSGDGSRIVGDGGENFGAFIWDGNGSPQGPVTAFVAERGKSTGAWHLGYATGISQDGYTICGVGVNPSGKTEGWVAVLPPILNPPTFVGIGPQTAELGQPFQLQVVPTLDNIISCSAKGLPAGFQIDTKTGLITGTWDLSQARPGQYTVVVSATSDQGTGTTTPAVSLTLPPPTSVKQIINGLGFLPVHKAPGDQDQIYFASYASALAANGAAVVGNDGVANDSRAFRSTPTDGISALPMLDGAVRTYGTALASSADGKTIVGQAAAPPLANGANTSVAVVWKSSVATSVFALKAKRNYAASASAPAFTAMNLGLFSGGIVSLANGASADGSVVCGYGDMLDESVNYDVYQAFRWTASSGMVGLGWLPGGTKLPNLKFSEAFAVSADGSTIVGASSSGSGNQAFRWTQAEGMVGLGSLPGSSFARANAISADKATIIGYSTVGGDPYNAGNNHAFRWTAAEGMTDLGLLPGDNHSEATAVSGDGSVVVGRSGVGFNTIHAFIWDKTNGLRDLRSVMVAGNPDLANWSLKSADGISADGKIIVGWGKNPNGDTEGFTAELDSVITITSFSPPSGLPGSSVTILGTRLTTAVAVKFNGTAASFSDDSDHQITATVPAGATTGPISITNPSDTATSGSSFTVLADSDGDGMPDNFEQLYFDSPTAGNPATDSDGDGETNLQEYIAGTNPLDRTSVLRIMETRRQGNDLVIVPGVRRKTLPSRSKRHVEGWLPVPDRHHGALAR